MAKITFNSTGVRNIAQKIRTNVGLIEDDIKKINSLCNNVAISWKGQDSTTYINKVNEKQTEISKITVCLKDLAEKLDKYATAMDQNQTNITSEGSKL